MSRDHQSNKRHHGLLRFLDAQTEPFDLTTIIDYIAKQRLGTTEAGVVIQELEATGLVFPQSDDRYVPRRLYFEGGEFLITLTDREIDERVLIPGHRFLPFVSADLDPAQLSIETEDGTALDTLTYFLSFEEAVQFHSLFGVENLPEVFGRMDRRNKGISESGDPRKENVVLRAYRLPDDVGPLPSGATVRMEVRDWRRGVLALRVLEGDPARSHPIREQDWIERLDRGFNQCFNYLGLTASIAEQLAYGYFFAGSMVLKKPPMSFASYLDRSDFVDFLRYGGATRLWRKGEEISDEILSSSPAHDLAADDPLETVLDDVRHPFTAVMVDAVIRNALASGSDSAEELLDEYFSYPYVEFESDEQEASLLSKIRKRFKDIAGELEPLREAPKVPLRERILDLLLSLATWLDNVDELQDMEPMGPETEARELRIAVERAESFLRILNDLSDIPSDLLSDLVSELETIEGVIHTNQHVIDRYLESGEYLVRYRPSGDEPGYRLHRRGEAETVYQLRVVLADVEPQIWRRILVPDNYTLEALHVVIQESFGWTNSHLHEFHIGGESYGVPEFDEALVQNLLSEAEHTLGEVIGDSGTFEYVYDLGSQWRHDIRVERRAAVDDVRMLFRNGLSPRCIGGEHAGPPEDCGGPATFQTQLGAYRVDPSQSELPVGYDPDDFDEETVNRRLAELENAT